MTALADRLEELEISAAELAAIVMRPPEEVEGWITATSLGGEAAVLCRFLADDTDALRRVEQLRRVQTTTLEGEGARYAGIEGVPYGTSDIGKTTGGRPA